MDTYSYLSVSTRSTKIGSSHDNMGCGTDDASVGVGGAGGSGVGVGASAGQAGGASLIRLLIVQVRSVVTSCPTQQIYLCGSELMSGEENEVR
jgi:hypothetical protein